MYADLCSLVALFDTFVKGTAEKERGVLLDKETEATTNGSNNNVGNTSVYEIIIPIQQVINEYIPQTPLPYIACSVGNKTSIAYLIWLVSILAL